MRVNGLPIFRSGIQMVKDADDDPEETIQIGVTRREVAIISFGMMMMFQIFPELNEYIGKFAEKIMEVGIAQDKLPELSDEKYQESLKKMFEL